MIIAGITGTIGTGKSTVAAMFGDLGAFIIDADKLAHEVVEPGKPAWQGIVDNFGRGLLNEDQTLNRQMLDDIVFKDPAKLQVLDSIVHPEVLKEDQRLVNERKSIDPDGLVIKDIPLLLEMGRDLARLMVDKIIVVYASPEIQLKRLIARGMEEADARNRINNQIPVKDKMKMADFMINNDGTLDETRVQVRTIYQQLMSGSTG
ncbi:MAG: dephospho-CoA kinase [Chloroflexi bacterium]|nr:dephospho-CoA kinase [Chloroflexota bacterium]